MQNVQRINEAGSRQTGPFENTEQTSFSVKEDSDLFWIKFEIVNFAQYMTILDSRLSLTDND